MGLPSSEIVRVAVSLGRDAARIHESIVSSSFFVLLFPFIFFLFLFLLFVLLCLLPFLLLLFLLFLFIFLLGLLFSCPCCIYCSASCSYFPISLPFAFLFPFLLHTYIQMYIAPKIVETNLRLFSFSSCSRPCCSSSRPSSSYLLRLHHESIVSSWLSSR